MSFETDFRVFRERHPKSSLPINGGHFEYYLWGSGRKTLVLLPGLGGSPDIFFRHFETLEKNFQVIALGYPKEYTTMDSLADGIAELLNFLGLKNIFLCGHSYGGFVAQCVAKQHPELISGLILSNTTTNPDNPSQSMEELLRQFAKNLSSKSRQKSIKTFLQSVPEPNGEAEYLTAMVNHIYNSMDGQAVAGLHQLILDFLQNQRFNSTDFSYLRSRILLLSDKNDSLCPPEATGQLAALFEHPIQNEVTGGHYATIVNPKQSVTYIRGFVNTMPIRAMAYS